MINCEKSNFAPSGIIVNFGQILSEMKLFNSLISASTVMVMTLTAVASTGCSGGTQKDDAVTDEQLGAVYQELRTIYEDDLSKYVIQPAEGYLKYPYLIPAGFYKQMWDWDGFFIGNYLCSKGKPEYLRYWALNLIEGIDERGYVSGCATTKGPRPIFGDFSMKPFLSQGVLLSSRASGDFSWIEPYYDKLCLAIRYREETQRDDSTGLFFWQLAMQSGADNNVALNYFVDDTRSFLACDASVLQMREYKAQSLIAKELGREEDSRLYAQKAEALKAAILDLLWCEEDGIFYNVDRETGDFYRRVSYSCFVPLIENILSQEQASRMITEYLANPDHMKSQYGYRSLSAKDPDYNNKNIIKPFSNWQGPVWPVANYIFSIGLRNYGFDSELRWLGLTMGKLMIDDYHGYGSLHENYNAETGAALAPADTYVDEQGKYIGFIGWNLCVENILAGLVNGDWMTLEIK